MRISARSLVNPPGWSHHPNGTHRNITASPGVTMLPAGGSVSEQACSCVGEVVEVAGYSLLHDMTRHTHAWNIG